MPRPRARALFDLGGQWIATEPGRTGYYRFWNDAGTGRTRRQSLGCPDFEEAKKRLAEIVVRGAPKSADTHLSLVLEQYFADRTDHLPSAKPARQAGALVLECCGPLLKVAAFDAGQQKKFIEWSLAKEPAGHSLGYIARNLSVIAAALRHARIPHELVYSEAAILARWPHLKPKPRRKAFVPTDAEVARIWAAPMPERLRRWFLIEMMTAARPEAVVDLAPLARDRGAGAIDLNPLGRRQNKKYRPKLAVQKMLAKALDEWECTMKPGERYVGYASVDSVDTALARVCARPEVDVPRMGVYSLRHKGATVMRLAGVLGDQRALQLGHRRPEMRTTDGYGEWHPDMLKDAAAALETWARRIMALAKSRSILAGEKRVA